MKEFAYPEISYQIIGMAYRIDNEIGYGQKESDYCRAYSILLEEKKIPFKREFYYPLKINEVLIAKRFFDFLVDEKIILEVKVGDYEYREACRQIFQYLKSSGMKLGIIIRFTKRGVKIKRIPNLY